MVHSTGKIQHALLFFFFISSSSLNSSGFVPSSILGIINLQTITKARPEILAPLLLSGTADSGNDVDGTSNSTSNIPSTPTKCSTDGNNPMNIQLSYSSYWNDLLQKEYNAASEELREKRRKWPRHRLEASGLSLFGVSAEPDSEVFGDKIVRVYKKGSRFLLRDKYVRGDVLLLTPEDNIYKYSSIVPRDCMVVDVGDDWMTLAVGPTWPFAELWHSRKNARSFLVRLDRTTPQVPLKAQRNALQRLCNGCTGDATLTMAGLLYGGMTHEHYLNETREIPYHFASASAPDDLENEVWKALKKATKKVSFNPNQSQMDAIAWALQRHISLIRGPPGTGKTRCASLLIATALEMRVNLDRNGEVGEKESNSKSTPPRVLAVTHSNGAADVLIGALLEMGVPAVRLGRPSSVSPGVQHRTIAAVTDKIPSVVKLRQKACDRSLDKQGRAAAEFELKQYILDTKKIIMKNAPVVVASCIGANQLLDEDVSFPIVVLDEAAQTTEPALICALTVAKADQIILIGDTKQLPPTITSTELRESLGVSPMSRLESEGVDMKTLCVQYRMPSGLLEHPSKYFYDGLVTCSKSKEPQIPGGFPWPNKSLPLAFISSSGNKEITHNFNGKSNPTEAGLVERVVSGLITHGDVRAKDIAVITPYSKQVQLIRMNLSLKGKGGLNSIQEVKVGTVDSFQGQETQVVIFSAVRSNDMKEMGFLRDPRRLNVAITRAKQGLILIGDKTVLNTCRHWSALLKSCEERGCLIDSQKQPLGLGKVSEPDIETKSAILDDSEEFFGLFSSKTE